MFTGIIEDVGKIAAYAKVAGGARATIATRLKGIRKGDSVAVEGCCLTATKVTAKGFDADLSEETLARTTLGGLGKGARVNLERALPAGARMGGHIVAGHVDGVGAIERIDEDGPTRILRFRATPELMPYVAEKGSIAVNGVSLTVNAVTAGGFAVTLIPFTLEHTTFGGLAAGAKVNLEADVIARYVVRGMEAWKEARRAGA